jgi:hypothetical protein
MALCAMLALAGTAGAQSSRLSYATAKKLAVQLAERQVANRDVVSYHLRGAERLNRRTIVFAYDDRTENDVFCTASLIVRQRVDGSVTRIAARFRGQRCAKIPADALAIEAATRETVRDLRSTAGETDASLRRLIRSVRRCRNLEVPRPRRAVVAAILDIATVQALEVPNDSALGDFVTDLGEIETSNTVLQRGIAGWADWVAVIRSLPSIPDPCATLQRWAQAGWSASETPIDMAAYRSANRRASADERAISRAARHLARVGVFPRAVLQFTPEGMLLRLAPDLPATGGRGKVVVRKPALL